MGEPIYGVDPEGEVTPKDVRDAIIECFYQAHCAETELDGGEGVDRSYCADIVRKAFMEAGGNFDSPDRGSIEGAMGKLAEFSKSFRDPSVIEGHMKRIGALVGKL